MSQRGFSLIELMLAMVIMTLGILFSLEAMRSVKAKMALSQLSGELRSAVSLAKTRALLGQSVVLCPKGSGADCGDDWSRGFQLVEGARVLRSYPVSEALRLYWHGFPVRQRVMFSADGLSFQQNGRFILCGSSGGGRILTLNRVFQLSALSGVEKTRLIEKIC